MVDTTASESPSITLMLPLPVFATKILLPARSTARAMGLAPTFTLRLVPELLFITWTLPFASSTA
jgi:hypothetical protein